MPKPRFFYRSLTPRLDALVRAKLWLQVMLALAAGIIVGGLLGPDLGWVSRPQADLIGTWLALPGKLFLALIRMVIIPLAASSIVLGIAGSGGGEALRSVGNAAAGAFGPRGVRAARRDGGVRRPDAHQRRPRGRWLLPLRPLPL